MYGKRAFLQLTGIISLLGLAGCFTGAGMPAGGDFIGGAQVVEAQLSSSWFYLGLGDDEIRSLHQGDTVFLESVTGSLYRQPDGATQPDMAIYFSIKPNFSIGPVSSRGEEEQASWLHAKIRKGVETLGGEYEIVVPFPEENKALKEYGEAWVYTPSGMSFAATLRGNKWWSRSEFNRFPRVLHVEGRATIGRAFLCWEGDNCYRIGLYEFKDARRFYQVYVIVLENEYKQAMADAMDFLGDVTFRQPKF